MNDGNVSHDPELQAKISSACTIIEKSLEMYRRPCVLSSFGKDSMLMLHMIRNWYSKDIPVVYFKQPYFPRKHAFGDRMAAELELEIYTNIPPLGVSITSKRGKAEIVQHFGMGKKHLTLPLGRQRIEGAPKWVCGAQTFASGPFGSFAWPFDVAFVGHKSADTDPVQGDVPLQVDIHQIEGSCHLAYPLRHFTDADVWRLTKEWDIPFNRLCYGQDGGQSDTESFWNPDYFPYCNRCLDPNEEPFVICPKTGLRITNISSSFPNLDPKLAYCST
jgi:hypothetical protein